MAQTVACLPLLQFRRVGGTYLYNRRTPYNVVIQSILGVAGSLFPSPGHRSEEIPFQEWRNIGVTMSDNAVAAEVEKTRPRTRAEKQVEHRNRIKRTLVACFMGILAGGLSFYLSGTPDPVSGLQQNAIIGILLLMAGVVFQKHIFMLLRLDYMELTSKDWFYQSFMTFALWFMTWTILLTTTVL